MSATINICYPSAHMRAAAIFGLGSSPRDLEPFQHDPGTQWITGLPAAPGEADAILIFGGDGTVNRHLPQLVKLGRPVLVVPRGSGNDFARALRLRSVLDAAAAWRGFCAHTNSPRAIDLGVITPLSPPIPELATDSFHNSVPGTSRYFCCVGGCGLDAEAGRRANSMPAWLRAHGGYVLALLAALPGFRPIAMKIHTESDSSPQLVPASSGPAMVFAFANAPAYGGGMRIAPRAQLDDGRLDFCLVNRVGKIRLSWLFPTVYFGRHLNVREINYFQSSRVRLETDPAADVYADGEFICRTPVEVGLAPRALTVIAGSTF